MNLLNCDVQLYKKKLTIRKISAVAVLAAVVILNVLLSVFRTDETHIVFFVLNIIADIACGWFLIAWYCFGISLQSKMLKLVAIDKNLTQTVKGLITQISENTQVVCGLQCLNVTIDSEGASRIVFVVKDGGIKLEQGKDYSLIMADNVATFAEAVI